LKILQKICFVLLLGTFSSVYGATYKVKLADGRTFKVESKGELTSAEAIEVVMRDLQELEFERERKEREPLNNKKRKFLKDIIKRFQDGCKKESGYVSRDCWPKYLPSKCRGLVYLDGNVPWQQCVMSCANESVYSKTFGECSH
jgi:hypothetical protein